MNIPRRLKVILSKLKVSVLVEKEKRGFLLASNEGRRMSVDLTSVVSMDQWDALAGQIRATFNTPISAAGGDDVRRN